MKKLILIGVFLVLNSSLKAFPEGSVGIEIRHLNNFDYEVKLNFYNHASDAFLFYRSATLKVYQRSDLTFIDSIICPIATESLVVPTYPNCGNPPPIVHEKGVFIDTFTFSPATYNHQGGYLINYELGNRSSFLNNIQNPGSTSLSIISHIPPVVDSAGNPFINSSPIFNMPVTEYAVHHNPFFSDYGGIDPDGDSLSYELYTPGNGGTPIPGSITAVSSPWPDPKTQFMTINWAQGYSIDNQIQGYPGPNPSPNRLKVNISTGLLSMTPDLPAPSKYTVGLLCREYRNGVLIGNYFRDLTLFVRTNNLAPNNPPIAEMAQLPSQFFWDGDTLVFTGNSICLDFKVTDPDPQSDIEMSFLSSLYDENDLSFTQSNSTISNQDTFVTSLCFSPDSIISGTSYLEVQAINNGCYVALSDTISFWFRFDISTSLKKNFDKVFKIYPNPASDKLNISLEHLEGSVAFEIFDSQGLKVKSKTLREASTSLSISDLPEGLYFYRIENGQRGKILIQR